MSNIRLRIQEARKQAGFSQSQLASMLEIGHRSIQRYENDNNSNISVQIAIHIAEACGVNPSYMLLGIGKMLQDEDDAVHDINMQNIELVTQFNDKETLNDILKSLLTLDK